MHEGRDCEHDQSHRGHQSRGLIVESVEELGSRRWGLRLDGFAGS